MTTNEPRSVAPEDLNREIEFDSPFEVLADGRIRDRHDVHAPSLHDDRLDGPGWSLVGGYSGQDRYSGPVMHNSEQFAGRMAADTLAEPGVYVLVVAYWSPEDDDEDDETTAEGWALARKDETS